MPFLPDVRPFHISTRKGLLSGGLLGGGVLSLLGCGGPSFLDPAGPIAAADRGQFLLTLAILLFVLVPIFVVLPWFAWRYRRGNTRATYRPHWEFSWPLEFFVWAGPILIVAVLGVMLWIHTHRLDPYKPVAGTQPPVEVQAVGLDWKWLFIYPEQNIATVNRLVIPQGRPVHITLTSDTVMQSLLIPQLSGQIYAMAGMRTQLNLKADRTGQFTGMNTQYNGKGFSRQRFVTEAVRPEAFDAWLGQAKSAALPLTAARYETLAKPSVVVRPIIFSAVQPDLFARIVGRYGHPAMPGENEEMLSSSGRTEPSR